jgi:hypothetical protein
MRGRAIILPRVTKSVLEIVRIPSSRTPKPINLIAITLTRLEDIAVERLYVAVSTTYLFKLPSTPLSSPRYPSILPRSLLLNLIA